MYTVYDSDLRETPLEPLLCTTLTERRIIKFAVQGRKRPLFNIPEETGEVYTVCTSVQ